MLVPILAAVAFVVVFIVGYRYIRGFYPGSKVIEEPEGEVEPGAPVLLFFYTTWCPHSQKALGEWKSLKTMVREQGVKFGGKTIQFQAVDGDSEKTTVARYNVEAYPTLILKTHDSEVHYESAFKAARIRTWLVDQLGPENM